MRLLHLALFALALLLVTQSAPALAATDSPAVSQAKKRLSDAQSALTKAKVQMSRILNRAAQQLEATPEWKKAQAAVKEAQAKHATAIAKVRNDLRQQPAYKAAIAERIRCESARDALRDQPNAPPDQRAQAAVALLNATAQMSHLEKQALASDPQATKAADDLEAANAQLNELRKQLPEIAKKDPEFEPARQQLEQAAKQANDAAQQVASAKRQQDQDDEKHMNDEINTKREQMQNLFRK